MNLRIARLIGVFSLVSCGSLVVGALTVAPVVAAGSCESLASMALPDTTITLAQAVPAGGFTQPVHAAADAEATGEHAAGVLPGRGHAETVQRFDIKTRPGCRRQTEREASGGGERCLQWHDRLRGDDDCASGRLRDHRNRHGPRRRQWGLRARPPRKIVDFGYRSSTR